jgi:hypothetical protein
VPPNVVVAEIVSDWASHSLPRAVDTVGIVTLRAAAKDMPVVDDMDPVVDATVEEFVAFDLLKEERRF